MSTEMIEADAPKGDLRSRSVAVMGCGAVTSIGSTAAETFAAMCAGASGLAPLRGFDRSRFCAQSAYEIDDRYTEGTDEIGRATRWLLAAIEEAARDGGVEDLSEVPIVIGTGLRELRSLELAFTEGASFNPAELDFRPALQRRFGARRVFCFANACSASLYALALACDLLMLQEAPLVVVAGVDSIPTSMFGLLDRVQLQPPEAVRPFDRDRRGVLMGDGAAAVIVRRGELLQGTDGQRAVRGCLRAVSTNADAFHATAPSAEGIAQAIGEAHLRAGVAAEDVDLILLHGTGTARNDEAEAQAISAAFGECAGRPAMTAVKSMVGHTSGGSGLLSLIVGLMAIETGRIPPTLGLRSPFEAAAGFDVIRDVERLWRPQIVEVHAFGFGGVNAVAILDGRGQ
jgi:3-oxoacyl-[acyl-carrier-protein] synthase II